MTHSKTAAIGTVLAVIAVLFLAGCVTGNHGVKRVAGSRKRREGARIHVARRVYSVPIGVLTH